MEYSAKDYIPITDPQLVHVLEDAGCIGDPVQMNDSVDPRYGEITEGTVMVPARAIHEAFGLYDSLRDDYIREGVPYDDTPSDRLFNAMSQRQHALLQGYDFLHGSPSTEIREPDA
ncbi:MAG TPA: hypothetical protein VHT70_01480 [Candidatus Saccharimonadales bacterium]|jgi:hypothetical protein|nr:hypothetical protein [Candidatus Saccharimonadales bacterium]